MAWQRGWRDLDLATKAQRSPASQRCVDLLNEIISGASWVRAQTHARQRVRRARWAGSSTASCRFMLSIPSGLSPTRMLGSSTGQEVGISNVGFVEPRWVHPARGI